MNRILKVLFINIILVISFLLNFQNNISYGENKNILEKLVSLVKKEDFLNPINNLKCDEMDLIKQYLMNEFSNDTKNEKIIVKKIKSEKQVEDKSSSVSYTKGIWPVENYYYISSGYGYRIHPITKKQSFHRGIDIPAPKNTPVLASDNGVVIFAGYKKGYGNVIEIKHFDNKKTLYAHNNSLNVKKGDKVKKGQIISRVGSTGNSTGNHVHFEIKINNKLINPIYGVNKN